jgi:glycosyltransferase involved in cell wall biosynthesis
MKYACISVVKNAEKSIAEWLAFHLAVGADAIFVLDNGSTDGTVDIIRQFAARFDIRFAEWPMTTQDYQVRGFSQAIRECRLHRYRRVHHAATA